MQSTDPSFLSSLNLETLQRNQQNKGVVQNPLIEAAAPGAQEGSVSTLQRVALEGLLLEQRRYQTILAQLTKNRLEAVAIERSILSDMTDVLTEAMDVRASQEAGRVREEIVKRLMKK